MYRPSEPFTVPLWLLKPTYSDSYGVITKTYTDGELIFASWKTYGGTEREVNGVYSIENTAIVETWYRPDIKSNCRLRTETGEVYEILGEPEDISLRHQFLKFKVMQIKGGA